MSSSSSSSSSSFMDCSSVEPLSSLTHPTVLMRTDHIEELLNMIGFFSSGQFLALHITDHLIWSSLAISSQTYVSVQNPLCIIMYLFSDFFSEYRHTGPNFSIHINWNELFVSLDQLLTKVHVHEVRMYIDYRERNATLRSTTTPLSQLYPFLIVQGCHSGGIIQEFFLPIYNHPASIPDLIWQPNRDAMQLHQYAYRFVLDIPCFLLETLFQMNARQNTSRWTTFEYDPVRQILYVQDQSDEAVTVFDQVYLLGPTETVLASSTISCALSSHSSPSSSPPRETAVVMIRTQDLLMALNIQFKSTIYSASASASSTSTATTTTTTTKAETANKKKVVLKPPKQSKKKQQRLTSYTRLFLETGHPLIFQYPFYTSGHDMTHSRIEQWIAQVKSPVIRPSELFGYQSYPSLEWTESHSLQFWSTLSPRFYNYIHELIRIMCILLVRDTTRGVWCTRQLSRSVFSAFLYSMINWVIPHDPQPLLDDSWITSKHVFSGFSQLHTFDVTAAVSLPSIDSFFQSHYHATATPSSVVHPSHSHSSTTKKKRTLLSAKRQRRSTTAAAITKKADALNDSIDTS